MLLSLVDPGNCIDDAHTGLSCWEDVEDLGPGETLIPALDIGIGVLGQTGIILQDLVASLDEMVDCVKGRKLAHAIRIAGRSRAKE